MPRFNDGDLVVFAKPSRVEQLILESNYDYSDIYYNWDEYMVNGVDAEGNVLTYDYVNYYSEDSDGNEYELDEPEGAGNCIEYDSSSEYKPYTKAMLKELVASLNNTNNAICYKVLQLYRKHNDNPSTTFKWRIA